MTTDRLEAQLALLAVERGYVTIDRMRAALAEQVRDSVRRPLGAVLVARGDLTDSRLIDLLSELDERTATETRDRRQDRRLGMLLVRRGLVLEDLVEECLHAQAEAKRSGRTPIPRIGELLVERSYAAPGDVRDALTVQWKTILACGGCNRRFNHVTHEPDRVYRCPECAPPLRPTADDEEVHVDRTATRLTAV